MNGHGAKFGRKKEEAIAALLTQRNMEEAARASGIGANTLLQWLQVPELKDAYRKARRDAYSQAMARIQQSVRRRLDPLEGHGGPQHAGPK